MKIQKYQSYNSVWTIVRRHLLTILPYLSFYKISNIIIAKIEEKGGVEKLISLPYFLKIEPTSFCNLNCTGCLHAFGRQELTKGNLLGEIDFEFFKTIITDLKKSLVKVSLYVEGEPLIYTRIIEMVKFLSENKIASVISSNFNHFNEEMARGMVEANLSHLIVSLDGYNQETYEQYRQGGSYEKVLKNLKMIIAEKKKQGSKYPLIEVQAINFKNSKAEDLDRIRKIAKDLGANSFLLKNDLTDYYNHPKPKKQKCFWLYGTPVIKWSGLVQPCCYYYDSKENDFGDLRTNTFREIWNNDRFRAARRYFRDGSVVGSSRCYDCLFFKK